MKWLQLIKKHKIVTIFSIVSFILIIFLITSVSVVAVNNEKDKQNRTFLDRDKTEIVCRRSEKIGSIKIEYITKDEPTKFKKTIQLWCTENPNRTSIDNDVRSAERKFFSDYKKTMNLDDSNIINWDSLETTSKEWNKKYILDDNNFDGYFIN